MDIKKRPPGGGLGGASEADGRSADGVGVEAVSDGCLLVKLEPHAIEWIVGALSGFDFVYELVELIDAYLVVDGHDAVAECSTTRPPGRGL